jgi:hypothetical protein
MFVITCIAAPLYFATIFIQEKISKKADRILRLVFAVIIILMLIASWLRG